MISVDDILKLVNAGFTKAEIMQLGAAPAGDPAPAPAPAPEDITQKLLNGITGQLQALTSAVQANNIRGANAPANAPETTEDIIKGMFNSK